MINAIADYTKSLVRLPRNPVVLLSRGTEYRERKLPGDPVRAVDDLTQAISLDDTIANGYYARGPAYFEVGEDFYIDALAGLLHAHEFRPDDPDSNRAVCWLLVVTEQADSAIPYCNVAVDGGVDDGYFTRGTAYLKINDSTALPKAVSDCTEAIRKDPFSLKAYMNRGSAYFKLGEVHYDQSIADLKHILTIDPAYRSTLNNLCWNMSLMGRSREGLTYCDRAINISPEYHLAYDSRGLARSLEGQYGKAATVFTKFLEWVNTQPSKTYDEYGPTRERWIETLAKGEIPFDEAELVALRKD